MKFFDLEMNGIAAAARARRGGRAIAYCTGKDCNKDNTIHVVTAGTSNCEQDGQIWEFVLGGDNLGNPCAQNFI